VVAKQSAAFSVLDWLAANMSLLAACLDTSQPNIEMLDFFGFVLPIVGQDYYPIAVEQRAADFSFGLHCRKRRPAASKARIANLRRESARRS
jgi:hypothetical protein